VVPPSWDISAVNVNDTQPPVVVVMINMTLLPIALKDVIAVTFVFAMAAAGLIVVAGPVRTLIVFYL